MKHTIPFLAARLLTLLAALLMMSAAWAEQPVLTALRVGERPQDGWEVLGGDRVMLRSPGEGLWSVATAWKDGWPADWQPTHPEKAEKSGDWTIVSGHLELPQGRLDLSDAYLHREDLKRLAVVMYRSEGQLLDPHGSQGEQIDHTNFAMTGEKNLFRLRGTYSEGWTPFWITAHFLAAAAEFERLGVDLDNNIE